MSTMCASEAFYKQLKSLQIEDFPCGLGSWRQTLDKEESRFNSGGVQFLSIEDLLELEGSISYAVDRGWSKEATSLRKFAIENPQSLQDASSVLKHFTTLRIVDKNVKDIDEGILQFTNLKELILSANYINKIDGRNLPKGLQVLELAANDVSDLTSLKTANFLSLLHLGLAQNQVNQISPCSFAPSKWPSLLSLDLSYNNLTDLQSTVEILKHLPVLRNLLLIGNPLHLSKCYHGFVIDNIPGLSYLDNHEVSADDKHQFKAFSDAKDLDVNSSYVTVQITSINDVKKPTQIEDPDAGEYPKIEFKYHVEFMFMRDVMLTEPTGDTVTIDSEELKSTAAEISEGHLDSISTDNQPWAEMLEFNFFKTFKISDLNRLRSFLKDGATFSVVAVKHSYVLEDPNEDQGNEGQTGGGAPEKQAGKTTSASKDRTKGDTKERKKSGKTKSATKVTTGKEKGGKKDKRDVSELFELPQERKTVGTCHVLLSSLLDGETVVDVSSPCIEKSEEAESSVNDQLSGGGNKSQSAKRNDDKKKGKGDGDKHLKVMPPLKGKAKTERGKSANTAGVKGNKAGKGKEKVEELNEGQGEEEAPPPPPPLSIKLEIRLERLTSTKVVLEDNGS